MKAQAIVSTRTSRRPFDVLALRRDFPILAEQVRGSLVYFDNGATGKNRAA
jgi:selenocysteine lyase/cysteine desulfurase